MLKRVLLLTLLCVSVIAVIHLVPKAWGQIGGWGGWNVVFSPSSGSGSLSPSATKTACNSCHVSRTGAASASFSPSGILLAKKPDKPVPQVFLTPMDLFVEAIAKKLGLATDKVADCRVFNAGITRICSNKPFNSRFASLVSAHYQGILDEQSQSIEELHNGKWKGLFPFPYYETIDPDTGDTWDGWAYLVNYGLSQDGADGCPNANWHRLYDASVGDYEFGPCYDYSDSNNPCYDAGADSPEFWNCAYANCPLEINDLNIRLTLRELTTELHVIEICCYRDGFDAFCELTCDSQDPELPCPE